MKYLLHNPRLNPSKSKKNIFSTSKKHIDARLIKGAELLLNFHLNERIVDETHDFESQENYEIVSRKKPRENKKNAYPRPNKRQKTNDKGKFIPLMGIEMEHLADAVGQPELIVQWTTCTEKKIKTDPDGKPKIVKLWGNDMPLHPNSVKLNGEIEPDAYDLLVGETDSKNKPIHITIDANRYINTARCGLEFVSPKLKINANGQRSKAEKEYFDMLTHYETWLTNQMSQKAQQLCAGKQPPRSTTMAGIKNNIDIEEWIDAYNEDVAKEKRYPELIITAPKHHSKAYSEAQRGKKFRWLFKLSTTDLLKKAPLFWYPQVNLSIPIEKMFSPEMRALSEDKRNSTYVMEEKDETWDFHVMRPRQKYLEFEKDVYQQSLKLADAKFKSIPSATPAIQGFLRTLSYVVALQSTPEVKLYELFGKNSEKSNDVKQKNYYAEMQGLTIQKDLYPMGMPKFTLDDFFQNMLNQHEKKLLTSHRKKIEELFTQSVQITNINDDSQVLHYNFENKIEPTKINACDFVKALFGETEEVKLLPKILDKTIDMANNSGVVEFRDIIDENYNFEAVLKEINKIRQKYIKFVKNN